jgi:hypothetical protein
MADVREDILVRLVELAGAIPGIRLAGRDETGLDETDLPAAVVLDGDEETDDVSDMSMRPPNRPTLVRMHPDILLIHQSVSAGSDLNTMRRELLKLVLKDTNLNEQIVKTGRNGNGVIRYLGCDSGFVQLRNTHGGMKAHFLFKYALKPEDL